MIPDEAVAAAARVIALGDIERTHCLVIAQRALEAAAPHMLAEAWDEGRISPRNDLGGTPRIGTPGYVATPNPYGTAK